jgi:hypothetical protein
MLVLFEVVVARGQDADSLLSAEVLQETQAQVMTLAEASAIGFSGARPDPQGLEKRLIAVAPRDARFVQSRLEHSSAVASFQAHEVET